MRKHLLLLYAMLFIEAAAVSLFAQDKVQHEYVDLGLSVKWATSNKPGYTDRSIFLPEADYWSSSLHELAPLFALGTPIGVQKLLMLDLVI